MKILRPIYLFLFFLGLMSTLYGQGEAAWQVDRDIINKLNSIEWSVRHGNASLADKKEALTLLQSAHRILEGRDHFDWMQELFCIDRDRDNRAPFVPAYHDDNYQLTRIREIAFGSLQQCDHAIKNSFQIAQTGLHYACVDRDADNRRPYMAFSMGPRPFQMRKITGHLFASYNSCRQQLQSIKLTRRGDLLFCSDRDNDGRSPYVMVRLNEREQSFEPLTDTFRTMTDCQNRLGLL